MARGTFERQLAALHLDIATLGGKVERSIGEAVRALEEADDALAEAVVRGDDEIDALRYRAEEACIHLFATQAPVASDLRWVASALIIASELERMGDYAEGIAKLARRINQEPLLKPLIDIPRMAAVCRRQLTEGLAAYTGRNEAAARRAIEADAEIDMLYDQVLRELLTYMLEDPATITRATYLLWVAHNLERIGDRATNVAERVIFALTGRSVESGVSL